MGTATIAPCTKTIHVERSVDSRRGKWRPTAPDSKRRPLLIISVLNYLANLVLTSAPLGGWFLQSRVAKIRNAPTLRPHTGMHMVPTTAAACVWWSAVHGDRRRKSTHVNFHSSSGCSTTVGLRRGAAVRRSFVALQSHRPIRARRSRR